MKKPEIHGSVFVAPNATVVGNVRIGAESSVFFGAVIRSELDEIVIGRGTNIQDNCVLHIERGMPLHVGATAAPWATAPFSTAAPWATIRWWAWALSF